jgi:hypothetical protein
VSVLFFLASGIRSFSPDGRRSRWRGARFLLASKRKKPGRGGKSKEPSKKRFRVREQCCSRG